MRISLVIPFYNAMPFFGDLLSSICSNMTEISDQGCFEFVFIKTDQPMILRAYLMNLPINSH